MRLQRPFVDVQQCVHHRLRRSNCRWHIGRRLQRLCLGDHRCCFENAECGIAHVAVAAKLHGARVHHEANLLEVSRDGVVMLGVAQCEVALLLLEERFEGRQGVVPQLRSQLIAQDKILEQLHAGTAALRQNHRELREERRCERGRCCAQSEVALASPHRCQQQEGHRGRGLHR